MTSTSKFTTWTNQEMIHHLEELTASVGENDEIVLQVTRDSAEMLIDIDELQEIIIWD